MDTEMTILIVDDDATVRGSIGSVLGDEGFAVVTAAGGEEALARLAESPASLVLLDVWMPEMDGIEVARHLMQYDFEVPPRIVFMTGIGESFDVNAIEDSDAIDVLLKPIAPSSVISLVRAMVDQPTTA